MFDFCSATLSSCKNGSELIWNEDDRSILLRTSVTDSCNVYFDKYAYPVITRVTTSDITTNSITLTVEVTAGESSIATYYYSNNDGESYEESESNTYTFSNLSNGTEYNFKVYAVDVNGKSSEVYTLQETTEDAIYIADYIKTEVYTGDGNGGLYLHDGVGTYTNANQETGDNSYRYAGANPNNYVCFGSDAEVCPADNLYRIIGVIDGKVKIIKDSSIGLIAFDETATNHFINTSMYTYLNETFYNTFSEVWQNKISTNTYYVNGIVLDTNNIIKDIYDLEMNNLGSTVECKIGLMYVSDYNYGSMVSNWNDYSLISNNNWLNIGIDNWLLTRNSGDNNSNYYINSSGIVSSATVEQTYFIRPVFYLDSTISITGGNGLETNPYRIGG